MNSLLALGTFLVAISISLADIASNLTLTVDGIVYSNVAFGAATPATVSVRHSTGITTIPLEKLSPELQKQFGYDSVKAAAYRAAETQRVAAQNRSDQQQRAAQTQK